jgi:hypothetical protein
MAGNIRAFGPAEKLPLSMAPHDIRTRVVLIERLMERAFVIPGIKRAVGFDAVIGLIPVAGDLVAGFIGLWLVVEARNLGMSRFTLARMVGNVALDTVLGSVPVVGDLFDVMFRSNTMNLKLIIKHLDRHHPETAVINA